MNKGEKEVMFRKSVAILAIFIFIISNSGCVKLNYKFGKLPSSNLKTYPETPLTKSEISVVAEVFNKDETERIFDANMISKGVQPVFIVIKNESNKNYIFKKENLNQKYIPAKDVAKKFSINMHSNALKLIPLSFIFIGIPFLFMNATKTPKNNKARNYDYTSNEIDDVKIGPGRSLSGVVFIPVLDEKEKLIISLVEASTRKKVVFEFDKS